MGKESYPIWVVQSHVSFQVLIQDLERDQPSHTIVSYTFVYLALCYACESCTIISIGYGPTHAWNCATFILALVLI